MNEQYPANMSGLIEDAEALLTATADVAGEKVTEARARLTAAIEKGRAAWNEIKDQTAEGAQAADRMIRDNPYQALGIAFGVGAVLGFLVTRR